MTSLPHDCFVCSRRFTEEHHHERATVVRSCNCCRSWLPLDEWRRHNVRAEERRFNQLPSNNNAADEAALEHALLTTHAEKRRFGHWPSNNNTTGPTVFAADDDATLDRVLLASCVEESRIDQAMIDMQQYYAAEQRRQAEPPAPAFDESAFGELLIDSDSE